MDFAGDMEVTCAKTGGPTKKTAWAGGKISGLERAENDKQHEQNKSSLNDTPNHYQVLTSFWTILEMRILLPRIPEIGDKSFGLLTL